MKKTAILLVVSIFLCTSSLFSQKDLSYFLTEPTLSPDGTTIVFVYENDLWKVEINGGTAFRLTALAGAESNPRFSPDGKWLAFSSMQNGNADIFIMPVDGGEIKQLTFHDANDFVESWSWNSEYINFSSNRYNFVDSYKIKISGGTPIRIFNSMYHSNAHHVIELPGEPSYCFTDSWESYMFPHRKRYKGAHNPDIQYYNQSTKVYKDLTSYIGKDLWPTVAQNGVIYYASDEYNDVYNLFIIKEGSSKRLTDFKSAIGRPQVSANGKKVVFTKDYQVFVYDTETSTTQKPIINIFKNDVLSTSILYKTAGKISNFDVSTDNKKIAFVSRGRLFVSDIKGEFVKELNTNNKERVIEVKWLADSVTLLYTQTVKGWVNLFTISANNGIGETHVTKTDRTEHYLELSPKRDKAVYISGNKTLCVLDLKSMKTENIVEDEFWFRGSQPKFSPDGKYITFTVFRNFESDVMVYSLDSKKVLNITNTGVPEEDPYWSPDGKYLYITADRFKPGFPRGGGESKIYRIPLYRFTKSFKSTEYSELFGDQKLNDTTDKVDIKFELEGISERWEQLIPNSGKQTLPFLYKEKEKELLFFNLNLDKGTSGIYKAEIKPFEKIKIEKIGDSNYDNIVKVKSKYYTLSSGDIWEINTSTNKLEKIDLNFSFNKNFQDEFEQLFYENWSALAENFYDDKFHGINWDTVKSRYESFLPYIRNRENLRTLQVDMLGELNASHLDFRSQGEEQKTFYKINTLETGIVFNNINPYVVDRIIRKSPADLYEISLKTGDELVAVNNIQVDKNKNRYVYFSSTELQEEIELTFKRGAANFKVKLHPISSRSLTSLLYDEWIADCQRKVDVLSQKKIAYVHMKNMSAESFNDFLIDMTSEAVQKDALILDLRYNTGGNVHDDVLQFLSQKPYLEWKFRDGKISPQPNFAPSGKPIVLLINEHSLSDAEMTAAGFKQLNLGKILGTETYRWIIFTTGRELVDGSFTRLPVWGCYDLKGNDLEITGAAPDIYLKNTFLDGITNKDPQLEKAIELLLKEVK